MQKEELLKKYLEGRSTPREEKELYRLLLQDNTAEQYRHVSYELWQKFGDQADLPAVRSQKMYAHIEAATGQQPGRHIHIWRYAAVASVILLLSATLFFLHFGDNTVHLSTAYAEKQEATLPDGSTVLLNANSELSYQDDWTESGIREVWLEGEAYFRVSKVSSKSGTPVKFVVHAQDLDIQVLGTAFNVQSTSEEVQVVLSEGSVRLANPTAQIEMDMEPGQLVAYSVQNQQAELRRVKTKHFSAWKEGRYVFEGLTLSEISEVLLHNYDKVVNIKGEALKQRRISATIPSTDLQVVLAVIKEAMKVEIIQQGDTIIIK